MNNVQQFTGNASSTTLQMEKMLRVFSPLYEKQMLTSPAVSASHEAGRHG
jgi:hypothetical protein